MGEMASRYRHRYVQTIYAQYIDIYCIYMHLYAGHILAIVLATISSKSQMFMGAAAAIDRSSGLFA